MYKYAWLTENKPGEYEVFNITRATVIDSELPKFVERIELAIESNYPIIGMKTSQWKTSAFIDAIWDGENFSGGMDINTKIEAEIDWNNVDSYAFLSNNKVIFTSFVNKNSPQGPLFDAAFSQNVSMIKINDDQIVTQGYIWDGTNFNPPA